jgi:Fe2+ or Zn2+ uptake regulation protein
MVASDTILATLDANGYRLTAPRRALAALVAARASHFTAEDLLRASNGGRVGLGRATVFRGLDTFAELGLVERLDLPDGSHAFVACEPSRPHHHHVVCSRCGRTEPVPDCGMAAVVAEVSRRTGFSVDTHRIELYGVCPACRESRP